MDALCPPLLPCFMEELWVDWRMKVWIKEDRVAWDCLVFVVGAPRERNQKVFRLDAIEPKKLSQNVIFFLKE